MKRFLIVAGICITAGCPLSAEPPSKVSTADIIHLEIPEYPSALRKRQVQGRGVFVLHVRPDGAVKSVETTKSTGHREMDESAKAALLKWRFHRGVPPSVEIPISFSFPHGKTE